MWLIKILLGGFFMAQMNWGQGIGLSFNSDEDYYLCLGYITNPEHHLDVYTHDNDKSGAWGGQGKLHNHSPLSQLPNSLQRSFRTSGDDRLSVSDYVRNLVYTHAFSGFNDPTGNDYTYYRYPESVDDVLLTIPPLHHDDFWQGYNL